MSKAPRDPYWRHWEKMLPCSFSPELLFVENIPSFFNFTRGKNIALHVLRPLNTLLMETLTTYAFTKNLGPDRGL